MVTLRFAIFAPAIALITSHVCAGTIAPVPYSGFDDSPWRGAPFRYFHLEDFEDHAFNVPGVSAGKGGVASVVHPGGHPDSVDLDDGALDGTGSTGDTFFSVPGSAGVVFTFDSAILGRLPTHAGIVWTDGVGAVIFEAFDASGNLIGQAGPVELADGSIFGETDEDRFFGVIHLPGISRIFINSTGSPVDGMELDHLQYGAALPVPAAIWSGSGVLCALTLGRMIRGWRKRDGEVEMQKANRF